MRKILNNMENRIKEQIMASGFRQVDVALKLGISPIGMNQLTKDRLPKFDTMKRIADAIGVPVWKLCLSDDEIAEIRSGFVPRAEVDELRHELECRTQRIPLQNAASKMLCPVCQAELIVVPISTNPQATQNQSPIPQ